LVLLRLQWLPVRFLLLIAIVVIAVYFIWKFIQDRNSAKAAKPASVISSSAGSASADKAATPSTTATLHPIFYFAVI